MQIQSAGRTKMHSVVAVRHGMGGSNVNKKQMRNTNSLLKLENIELKEQVAEWKARHEKFVREAFRKEVQLSRQIDLLQEELRKVSGATVEQNSLVEAYRKVLGNELNRQQPTPVHILWTEVGK
jgi:hypothetical protein